MGEIFSWRRPAHPLQFTGERWTSAAGGEVEYEHLHRYLVARDLCRGKDVLDIACGEGYGGALLAQVARRVVGVDIDPASVAHAVAEYAGPNLGYIVGDARSVPLATASFDVVVSFETLEHFAEQEAFLAEMRRVLRPAGVLLISTPDCDVYSPAGRPANPHHVRELSREEFGAALAPHFRHVSLLAQRPLIGSAIAPRLPGDANAAPVTYERRGGGNFERSPGVPRAVYLIACASNEPVAEPVGVSLYIHGSETEPHPRQDEPAAPTEPRGSQAEVATARAEVATARAEAATARAELAVARTDLAATRTELAALRSQLADTETSLAKAGARAAEAEQRLVTVEEEHTRLRTEWDAQLADAVRAREEAEWARAGLEREAELKREQLASFLSSTTWRSTYPLRVIGAKLPLPVRSRLRNAARFAWRTVWLRRRIEPLHPHPPTIAAASVAPAVQPSAQRPAIVFVSGFPDTPSEAYRVFNPMSVLRELRPTHAITADAIEANTELLAHASIIVLFRIPWSPDLRDLLSRARSTGTLVVYDIDDYVFEPEIAKPDIIDGMRFLNASDLKAYHQGVQAYRQALQAADFCTVPTEFLAQRVRELGGTAFVLRNSVSPAMLLRYDRALRLRRQRQPDGYLRVGYAAGTRTHQRDFAQVAPVLAGLLRQRDKVMLTVVGHLDVAEYPALAGLSHRIEQRPPVPHDDLSQELMRFDINIAPLEIGNPFCEAKSELKFFNAALVEVPTVASATAPFRAAIRDGESGFLATDAAAWSDALFRLIDDPELRARVGKLARTEALKRFGPGTMRIEVRETFEELWRRRRPVTPPRRAGYDHFLYAINYPAAPARPAAGAPLARSGRTGPRKSLDLQWIIPHFSVGWGGMTTVLRIVQQLEKFGHRNTLWVHNAPPGLGDGAAVSRHYRDLILKHFPAVAAQVSALPVNLDLISGDAVIATDHFSAYPARAIANVARRFYFLQDNEPAFSPAGYAGLFAEATYRFGFDALSNGEWLHSLAQQFGMWSVKWELAADPDHYFTSGSEHRLANHVAFYARQETPRRAVELGYLAAELLARDGIDLHLHLFGSEHAPASLPCRFTHHGILGARQLGQLYRRASVGMVFSATNYSLIPREMMACGLPVLELNSESSRASFPNGVAELADPVPESVAAHLKCLLLDRARRKQLVARALKFVGTFSWEKSARDIERALVSRVNGIGETRCERELVERMAGQ